MADKPQEPVAKDKADMASTTDDHDHHGHGHDHGHNHNHDHDHADHSPASHSYEEDDSCCSSKAAPIALAPLKASVVTGDGAVTAIRIMQMDCPTEENLIQNKLGGMKTVKSLDFNVMQRVLTVVHEPAALEAKRKIAFVTAWLDRMLLLSASRMPFGVRARV